jgi:hypothetical protein
MSVVGDVHHPLPADGDNFVRWEADIGGSRGQGHAVLTAVRVRTGPDRERAVRVGGHTPALALVISHHANHCASDRTTKPPNNGTYVPGVRAATAEHFGHRRASFNESQDGCPGTITSPSQWCPQSAGRSSAGCRWHDAVGVSASVGCLKRRSTMPRRSSRPDSSPGQPSRSVATIMRSISAHLCPQQRGIRAIRCSRSLPQMMTGRSPERDAHERAVQDRHRRPDHSGYGTVVSNEGRPHQPSADAPEAVARVEEA